MRLLLDTHVFIWSLSKPKAISAKSREAIASSASDVYVSAATAWEISIKRANGRIDFPLDRFASILEEKGFWPLPIELEHAVFAGTLPPHHSDPFDRMLIAQARTEALTIVTADPKIGLYDVPTIK